MSLSRQRTQAENAQMVASHRRRRLVSADSDNSLTPPQLYQHVLRYHDDLDHRDSKISRLHALHLQYEAAIDQLLLSSSTSLDHHTERFKQRLVLRARQQVCYSAVTQYRRQFSEILSVNRPLRNRLKHQLPTLRSNRSASSKSKLSSWKLKCRLHSTPS